MNVTSRFRAAVLPRLMAAAVGLVALATGARATVLDRLNAAMARGEVSYSEAARQKLLFLFDRPSMDARWGAAGEAPAKCGTRILAELTRERERLDPGTRRLLDQFLARAAAPGTDTYTTAHFRIEYATSGPDAPIATDIAPPNGIPDFVEWTGAACEQAWEIEVGQLGYTAPEVPNGQNARYPVTYLAQDSYGFTILLSDPQTEIVLHPSYAGFPTNDDPEGDVIGALRVTVAHELKHAIQRMYSPWSEDGWLELDATWAEEVVFDQVNDYYNFIRGAASPFTAPQLSLIAGGTGSYEDCNWELYQTQTLGLDHMRRFWERRRDIHPEPVLSTYEQNFITSGTTLNQVWGEYVAWNFASGERAAPGFGYPEAAAYPTTPAAFVHEELPVPATPFAVNGLASTAHWIPNPEATLGGTPEFTFVGAPGCPWQVSLLLCARSGTLTRIPVPLSGGAATVQASGVDWGDLAWAALVAGNPIPVNPAATYSFSARAVAPVTISHHPLSRVMEGPAVIAIRARVLSGTSVLDPASVTLTYRVNEEAEVTIPMASDGAAGEYSAAIPALPAGAVVDYRIRAASVSGAAVTSPSVLGSFHRFEVTNVYEPFESAGGWTVGDAGDAATSGVWERARPVGSLAAPYEDATSPPGSACFLTQNGSPGDPAGLADVDAGKTTLLSPVFGFWNGGPFSQAIARYRRWYSNQVGARPDDVWRVDASNDGGISWTPIETAGTGENRWVPVVVDLLALFGTPARVRFRFVAEDAGATSLVEAAVDDFEILALPQNPVGVPAAREVASALGPPVPNPSRGMVRMRLDVPGSSAFVARVRDLQGRSVRHLAPGSLAAAGGTWLAWDGRTDSGALAPPGLYVVDVRVGRQVFRRALVRLGVTLAGP